MPAPGGVPADAILAFVIEPFHFSLSQLTLTDGTQVMLRCIAPADEPGLIEFHHALSDRSVHFRYFGMPSLGFRTGHERLAALCAPDPEHEIAVVAVEMEGAGVPRLVGIGRLIKTPGADEAEFALVVADCRQGAGLGTALLEALVAIGRKAGVCLFGHILPGNVAMLHASRHLGFQLQFSAVDQQWEARLELPPGDTDGKPAASPPPECTTLAPDGA